ncbi:beta subunit of gdp-forming succinate-CoA ligase [Microdochium trichocladiopsis]|uniref:Succinate--CoA ligase [ADP-forming] subunit beta, mitochondrial n=1 Tax=Microdochium trichocladiopsis TaxID=1682393 RepID=A0A9P8Y031_9PEZI|nr:beta subunit of gdp-forming succinate-CoA ligase [Microdochium trichocladiopsis]KAH7024793.1 beta subunit of gdp-forming succinate-CoA ligase [Microdochium trichocladiopsis]
MSWTIPRRLLSSNPAKLPHVTRQVRRLSLYEYQSKDLLKEYGVPVQRAKVATTPSEVASIIRELDGTCVIKAQILKGGRGKGRFDNGLQGGVHLVKTAEEGEQLASKMLGYRLQTKQTGPEGLRVNKLYVAQDVEFRDEWYLALIIDRENYTPGIVISKSGGVDIEATSRDDPASLHSFSFSVSQGITDELVRDISQAVKFSPAESNSLKDLLIRLYNIFTQRDATMLEINPLVSLTAAARSENPVLMCIDAKFEFDNAAKSRQKHLFGLGNDDAADGAQEAPEEEEAGRHGLVYVKMDGNIGNVVNGAGLAMATNDAIAHCGGSSANFLDTGGQATVETMQKAFEIILWDERVKVVLVNIYGGIVRCDMIAQSIITAAERLGPFRVPVVVRLQGTNSAEGLKLIQDANLGLHVESGFGEAASKAVELANGLA